jgi:hypothetical protein
MSSNSGMLFVSDMLFVSGMLFVRDMLFVRARLYAVRYAVRPAYRCCCCSYAAAPGGVCEMSHNTPPGGLVGASSWPCKQVVPYPLLP